LEVVALVIQVTVEMVETLYLRLQQQQVVAAVVA
jgi:hypothetical protein